MRTRPPALIRWAPVFLDWPNRQRYLNFVTYQDELRAVPDCEEGVDTRELPEECLEGASTPQILYRKLNEWGFPSLVIPHGTTWGLYTPAASSWDKQLTRAQHDPSLQTLVEVFSGHGNSEEYRTFRAADVDHNDELLCPEPHEGYEPCCWRAGELIRARCGRPGLGRVRGAGAGGAPELPGRRDRRAPHRGRLRDGRLGQLRELSRLLPAVDALSSGQLRAVHARPNELRRARRTRWRFHFGFLASSDNHRARPGTGYKEYARMANTEASGAKDETWHRRLLDPQDPRPDSLTAERDRRADRGDPVSPPRLRASGGRSS